MYAVEDIMKKVADENSRVLTILNLLISSIYWAKLVPMKMIILCYSYRKELFEDLIAYVWAYGQVCSNLFFIQLTKYAIPLLHHARRS